MEVLKNANPFNRVTLDEGFCRRSLVAYYCVLCFAGADMSGVLGFYLWGVETENKCYAPVTSIQLGSLVNVSYQFKLILTIFFAYYVVETFRSALMLLAILVRSKIMGLVFLLITICNEMLGIAVLMTLHIWRFQYSGKLCSGDYIINKD